MLCHNDNLNEQWEDCSHCCNKREHQCNCDCCRGPRGFRGPTGQTGATGATGPTGGGTQAAYGGMYNSGSAVLFLSTANDFKQLTFNNYYPAIDVTYNKDNTITIEKSGIYEINYNFIYSANVNTDVITTVRRNGAIIQETRGYQTLYAQDSATHPHDDRVVGCLIVELNEGDKIDIATALATTGTSCIVVVGYNANSSFTVKKIGDSQPVSN